MFNSNNNQNKPPAFPLQQPAAPEQIDYNWSINDMPWKSSNEKTSHSVMLFNGLTLSNNAAPPPSPTPTPSTSGFFKRTPRVKRKSESDKESDDFIPSKQYVSEEKMIAHMNGLHLSDNFQAHETHQQTDSAEVYNVNLSPHELEQRLKNAQRITVCDQLRKSLREDNEIIPKVLLNRIEEPCRALVLWRPPEPIDKLLTVYESRSSDEEEIDMDGNNNNNNNNDPNNNMDMDM